MDIIINEREKAEEIIETGEIYKNLWQTKALLIKYYHSNDLSDEEIKTALIEFLDKNIKHNTDGREYNLIKDMDSIDSAIKIYTKPKHKLSEDKFILISKQELEKIKALGNISQEKLAFVLLVLCKIKNLKTSEFTEWINDKTKEFYKYSKNRGGVEYQEKMLHKLYKANLIDLPPLSAPNNISLKLLYIDEEIKDEDVEMKISDFREVVLNYLKWSDKKAIIVNCEICGKLVKTKSKKTKYCSICKRDKQLIWQQQSMEKLRNKENVK